VDLAPLTARLDSIVENQVAIVEKLDSLIERFPITKDGER
jgi:hypothetical protein